MTKTVRVENACGSNYKVQVLVYEMKNAGEINPAVDSLVYTIDLDYPTALLSDTSKGMITATRYMVIKENGVRA